MLAPLKTAAVILVPNLKFFSFFFSISLQATIGIDFLSKTMYLEDRTVSKIFVGTALCTVGTRIGICCDCAARGSEIAWKDKLEPSPTSCFQADRRCADSSLPSVGKGEIATGSSAEGSGVPVCKWQKLLCCLLFFGESLCG